MAVTFRQLVDCPECDATFEVEFPTDLMDKEDLVEAPETEARCPAPGCGHVWPVEYEGWTSYSDGA